MRSSVTPMATQCQIDNTWCSYPDPSCPPGQPGFYKTEKCVFPDGHVEYYTYRTCGGCPIP